MKNISSIGVEFFAFLSGMGLFYAMSKSRAIFTFYLKRLNRVFVPYVIVGGVYWYVIDFVHANNGLKAFVKDFTTYSFWSKGEKSVWYITFLLLTYLLFPLIYKLITKNSELVYIRYFGVLLAYFVIMIILIWRFPEFVKRTEMCLGRLLPFLLGVGVVDWIEREREIRLLDVFVICILSKLFQFSKSNIGISACKNLLGRWSSAFYGIFLMIMICQLLALIKNEKVHKVLCWFGKYTLELYLVHVCIREALKAYGVHTARYEIYLGIIAVSLVLSPIIYWISSKCSIYKIFRLRKD